MITRITPITGVPLRPGDQWIGHYPAGSLLAHPMGEHREPRGAALVSLRTQRSVRFKHRRRLMFNWAAGPALFPGRALVPAILAARVVALPNDPDRFWRAQARLTARLALARVESRDWMRERVALSLFIRSPRCSVCGEPMATPFHSMLRANPRLERIH